MCDPLDLCWRACRRRPRRVIDVIEIEIAGWIRRAKRAERSYGIHSAGSAQRHRFHTESRECFSSPDREIQVPSRIEIGVRWCDGENFASHDLLTERVECGYPWIERSPYRVNRHVQIRELRISEGSRLVDQRHRRQAAGQGVGRKAPGNTPRKTKPTANPSQ